MPAPRLNGQHQQPAPNSLASKPTVNRSDLIAKVKFTNELPGIPFDPKLIEIQTELESLICYKPNVLENLNHDLHTEIHMGIPLDLIDQKKYEVPPNSESLPMHPKDEELLRDDLMVSKYSKRSEKHSKVIPWLRKTEYVVSGFNHSRNDGSFARKSKLLAGNLPNREQQIEAIKDSFNVPEITSHHTKPDVKPVSVMDLVPDLENWGHSSSLVLFDQKPASKRQKSDDNDIKHAIMKGMLDSNTNDQFVAYFLPDADTLDTLQANKHMQRTCYYNLNQEYNWNFKNKDSKGFDDHLCFSERDGKVYYNEISTIIQLGRRKTHRESGQNSTLVVKYGEPSQSELQAQEKRLEQMRPSFKEFDGLKTSEEISEMEHIEKKVNDDIFKDDDLLGDDVSEEEIRDADIFGSDLDD